MYSKVSLIIPVYRVESYIAQCAESLLAQTYRPLELIFVDDCSPDGSIDRLKEVLVENKDVEVKIVRHDHNQGSAAARNSGLMAATGDYISFADGDDWVEPDYVADMVDMMQREELDIGYCDYYETFEDHDVLLSQDNGTNPEHCIVAMMCGPMHGSTCNKMYRKAFLEKVGEWFVPSADLYEDVAWNVRLMANKPRLGYLPKAYYHYVQYNAQSIIKSMGDAAKGRRRTMQRIRNVDVACRYLEPHDLLKGKIKSAADEWKLMAKNDLITASPYSLKRWMVTFPEADAAIWKTKKITVNLKLLLTWLHHELTCVYHLQKRLTHR